MVHPVLVSRLRRKTSQNFTNKRQMFTFHQKKDLQWVKTETPKRMKGDVEMKYGTDVQWTVSEGGLHSAVDGVCLNVLFFLYSRTFAFRHLFHTESPLCYQQSAWFQINGDQNIPV